MTFIPQQQLSQEKLSNYDGKKVFPARTLQVELFTLRKESLIPDTPESD